MTWLVAVLIAGMLVCLIRGRRGPPILKKVSVVLAVAAIALVLWSMLRSNPQSRQFLETSQDLQKAIGFKLGQTLARAFPQGGDVLVLLDGLPAEMPTEGSAAAQMNGLRSGLGRTRLHPVLVNAEAGSDPTAMEKAVDWRNRGVSLSQVKEWYKAHEKAVVVVSFLNLWHDEQGEVPERLPPIFTVGTLGLPDWAVLVKQGVLKCVVVQKPGFKREDLADKNWSDDKVFDQCCDLVTATNAAKWITNTQ